MNSASPLKPIIFLKVRNSADEPFFGLPPTLKFWGWIQEFLVLMAYAPLILFSRKKILFGLISLVIWYFLFMAVWDVCKKMMPPVLSSEATSTIETPSPLASTSTPASRPHKHSHNHKPLREK